MRFNIITSAHGVVAEWQTQQTQNLPTINRVGSSPTSPTKIVETALKGCLWGCFFNRKMVTKLFTCFFSNKVKMHVIFFVLLLQNVPLYVLFNLTAKKHVNHLNFSLLAKQIYVLFS